MSDVDTQDQSSMVTEKGYRIEVSKNTKGYNFSVKVAGDVKTDVKNDTEELVTWAQSKYGS